MKNSNKYTMDQADTCINESEVFEILAEEVRSNHSQKFSTPAAPAPTPAATLPLKTLFKPATIFPEFTADKTAASADQQKLIQSLIFLEEENKFLKMNNSQLLESVNKFQTESEEKTSDFKIRWAQAESEINILKNKNETTTTNNTNLLEENRKFKFTITDLNSKLTRVEEKERLLVEKLEALDKTQRSQDEERNKQLYAQEKQNNAIQYELLDKTRMINELNFQINEMQITQQQANQQLTTLTAALDRAQLKYFEYNEKDKLIDHLNAQIADLQKQIDEAQATLTTLTAQASGAAIKSTEYAAKDSKLNELSEKNSELHKQLHETQEKLDVMRTRLNEEIQTLQVQLGREQNESKRLSLELATQNQDQKQIADTYQMRLRKLNSYFVEIEQTKMKFQTNLSKLTAEIQEAVRLHPLKDYYNLTCKEVIRVEIDLKKTPTSSPNRKSLEKAMEQLINQREYLKEMIGQYESSLTQKQASVDRMWPILNVFDTSKNS